VDRDLDLLQACEVMGRWRGGCLVRIEGRVEMRPSHRIEKVQYLERFGLVFTEGIHRS
jgi:hypothetical protein